MNRRLDGFFDAPDGLALIQAALSSGRGNLAARLAYDDRIEAVLTVVAGRS